MTQLPLWFGGLLPVIAAALAVLLLASTMAAIHQFRTSAPPRRQPPKARAADTAPGGETAGSVVASVHRAATQLSALTGNRRGIGAVPLLVAVGAGSDAVQRLIPASDPGDGDLARAQRALFQGDCRISVSQGGAVVSFEDGLLGSDRWEARWTALVGELLRSRADRPFDGLMVMLEARNFFGPTRRVDDELVALGGQLYQLIWLAQRAAGWRVPIYLVISQSEVLTGFTATVAALPEPPSPMRDAPFGWAVPYALATAFERGWVREGINALVERLSIVQSSLLMRSDNTENAEQLLLFPHAVAALAEPLSTLLTPMLRPSAYHDAFMFRGFYLTGRADAGAAGAQDPFTARLFSDRFFPEHVLAQPAQGATTRRQRHIRIAQGTLATVTLLAVIGVSAVRSNREAVNSVRPLVEEIASLGGRLQVTPGQGAGVTSMSMSRVSAAETQQLLLLMSGVSLNRLETAWAPLSFVSDADATVERVIRGAYQIAVLREVGGKLTSHVPALLGVGSPVTGAEPESTSCAARGATVADVERLQQITRRLGNYGLQLQRYQDLTVNPRIDNLQSLLEFVLSVELPAGFSSNHNLYLAALHGATAPPLLIGKIRAEVATLLRTQFARAFDGAYPGSPLGLAVDAVVRNANLPSPNMPAMPAIGRLGRLDTALHAIQTQAPLPENDWFRNGTIAPSIAGELDQVEKLSSSVAAGNLAPVDANLPAELRRMAGDCLTSTRSRLLGAHVFGGVPVVDGPAAQLSPPLLRVIPALDSFLAQPLVSAKLAPVIARPAASGGQLFWDSQDLQSLQDLTQSYLLFVAQDLPVTLPALFHEEIQAAAGEQLDQLVENAITRAQQGGINRRPTGQVGSATGLHDEITRFGNAAPVLENLSIALREAGRIGTAEHLDQLLSDQAIRLLHQVDTLLTQADPYQLVDRSLSFWSGTSPIAAAAFGAATLPELVSTLPARRDYVEALARDHAAPLAAYLQQGTTLPSGAGMTLLKRWQGILDTLDRYHRSDPANSLSRLEQFISADMDHLDLMNCGQVATTAARGTDWFAEQLGNIRSAVGGRCGKAAYSEMTEQYGELSTSFNRDLAGRFPFGPTAAPDADPGDVKRFYSRFGADLSTLEARLAKIGSYNRAGAGHFISQLLAVQDALAPLLSDPSPTAALTYDVDVAFRTNSGSDPGANQVAETTVQFGQRQLSSFAAAKTLAWSSGEPVQVLLRWAENAPAIPSDDGKPPTQVRGLVASYQYTGAWALLRMIVAQTPGVAVLAQISDRRPETIGFTVPLKQNPQAVSGGDTTLTSAQLFMRFGLTASVHTPGQPDKHQAVVLPNFPTAAPQARRTVQAPVSSGNKPIRLQR